MKKRILAALLLFTMVFTITGCSNHKAEDKKVINQVLKNIYEVTDTTTYENLLKSAGNVDSITSIDQIPTNELENYKKPFADVMSKSQLDMYFSTPAFLDVQKIAYETKNKMTIVNMNATIENEKDNYRQYEYIVRVKEEKGTLADDVVLNGKIIMKTKDGKSYVDAFQRALLNELKK